MGGAVPVVATDGASSVPSLEKLPRPAAPPAPDIVEGHDITTRYDGRCCIPARMCVTQAPASFLEDVDGPWVRPDASAAETDGPLQVHGNLEVVSGTGRTVARLQLVRLCRCRSANKPCCDDTHHRIAFQVR